MKVINNPLTKERFSFVEPKYSSKRTSWPCWNHPGLRLRHPDPNSPPSAGGRKLSSLQAERLPLADGSRMLALRGSLKALTALLKVPYIRVRQGECRAASQHTTRNGASMSGRYQTMILPCSSTTVEGYSITPSAVGGKNLARLPLDAVAASPPPTREFLTLSLSRSMSNLAVTDGSISTLSS